MSNYNCRMCGAILPISAEPVVECEYCGSRQPVPSADSEKKQTLFARANRLRLACEFDRAATVYESIAAEFPDEAEASWGIVLCRYGIEYVDDPATGKKVPTCHRSSYASVLDDPDYQQTMDSADPMARRLYHREAAYIEELRERILSVSASEKPYDIFICYKETAEDGGRTLDSVLAQDLYDLLTGKGYRVFFSRISLEDKLGREYEPYIFAALNSAKVMLAMGTCFEHYDAVWVKNEWSRFLKLMEKDREKYLIPCYKDIDAYDMPKEFRKLQAQDLGKVGAHQDLLRGIEKILPRQTEHTKGTVVVQQTSGVAVAPLLKRAFMYLEDGDWKSADEYCERVLDIDPEFGEAYLGKLMAELRVKNQDALRDCAEPFDDRSNYQKAMRFGNSKLREMLEGCTKHIKARNEEARRRAEEERIAREKREAQERIARIEKLAPLRKKLQCVQNRLSSKEEHIVGLKQDGTVVAVGDNAFRQCNVSEWEEIVAISAGCTHTVGLKSDGTVVVKGSNDYGECDVSEWKDIVAIGVGESYTVGLKSDGTVVVESSNDYGEYDVSEWKDIIAISAGNHHIVGLMSDGTMVAVGDNTWGECDVSEWKDIVAISAGYDYTVGLKPDGTVVAVGRHDDGQCNVSGWEDIVAISACYCQTVGLKSDGTVVAEGSNDYGECDVSEWKDIVAISGGTFHTVGLRSDGTVVVAGDKMGGKGDVDRWRLFQSIGTIEEEMVAALKKREEEKALALKKQEEERQLALKKQEEEKERQRRRKAGLCQHCGGSFSGFLTKKCANCGRKKDY